MKKKKKYKEKQSHKADAKWFPISSKNGMKGSKVNKTSLFFGQKIPQLQEIGIYRQLLDTKAVSWVFLKCDCHNTSNR